MPIDMLAVRREDGECVVTRRVLPFDGPTAQAPVSDRRHAGKLIPQANACLLSAPAAAALHRPRAMGQTPTAEG